MKVIINPKNINNNMGLTGNRQVYIDNKVQQRLSMSRNKRLNKQAGEDINLAGLVIDWHLADTDQVAELFSAPSLEHQPIYAYA